ncbi:MAG: DUF4125 family protein [Desulfosarcinaceae bacterium]|nr:DUF4125 family protein [Desulfosarcinaceae bacterium]
MSYRSKLIQQILNREWALFQQVQGQDGPAACQQDRATFDLMRHSQALAWSVETLESYLADLQVAQSQGRNLITEKYARMMASTDPQAYARIAPRLPPLGDAAARLIDLIVDAVLTWESELARAYPNLMKRGRPLPSSADSPEVTSLETYLRGELATYSQQTLAHYLNHIREQQKAGINGARITLQQMVTRRGFASLEDAEKRLRARA